MKLPHRSGPQRPGNAELGGCGPSVLAREGWRLTVPVGSVQSLFARPQRACWLPARRDCTLSRQERGEHSTGMDTCENYMTHLIRHLGLNGILGTEFYCTSVLRPARRGDSHDREASLWPHRPLHYRGDPSASPPQVQAEPRGPQCIKQSYVCTVSQSVKKQIAQTARQASVPVHARCWAFHRIVPHAQSGTVRKQAATCHCSGAALCKNCDGHSP